MAVTHADEHDSRVSVTVAGRSFDLTGSAVRAAVAGAVPDPVAEHFVLIDGRRYPPKQVLALVTGLDRADFTTHHARRTLRRLGLAVGRRPTPARTPVPATTTREDRARWPYRGRQADALRPHQGRWVGLRADEVLVVAHSRAEVVEWMRRHDRDGMVLRVPSRPTGGRGDRVVTFEGWTSMSAAP